MHRVRVAGHICLDLIPAMAAGLPGPGGLAQAGPLQLRLGGCVANTGLALAALGAPVELVAVVGDDLLGDAVSAMLGSGTASVRRIERRSTSYSVVLEPPGEDRRFLHHVGTNEVVEPADVPIGGTDLLHVGYPQLLPRFLRDEGAPLAGLLDRANAAGCTTSVDFATADPALAAAYPWPAMLRRWAPLIDVFSPSVDDLLPAFPGVEPEPARFADELVRAGVGIALVTAGAAGMCLRTAGVARLSRGGRLLAALPTEWADRQLSAPAGRVAPVRTTAAGDIATAGLLFGLLAGLGPEEALRLAAAAAALHVSGVEPLPSWGVGSAYGKELL